MIRRSISVLVLVAVALATGLASAQQEAEQPPRADQRFVDPRGAAPTWRGPGWWDTRFYRVDVAMVRVAHLSPNTGSVDINIGWPEEWWEDPETAPPEGEEIAEGRTQLEGLEYQQVTDYVMVPAGTHRVSIVDPEGEQVALYETEIDLNSESYYTLAAVGFVLGEDEDLDARVQQEQERDDEGFFTWLQGLFEAEDRDADDLSLRIEAYDDVPNNVPGAGSATVRVINAAAGSPDVDVLAFREALDDEEAGAPADAEGAAAPPPPRRAEEFTIASELSFPGASGYENVRSVGYRVEVRDLATNDTILEFPGGELAPGSIYTIMVTGTAVADYPVEAILLEDVRLVSREVEEPEDGEADDGEQSAEEEPAEEPQEAEDADENEENAEEGD